MAESLSGNRAVTPNEAKKSIRKCVKIKRPVFMWGAPGIGKSDIVKQIGDEQNREVIDVRLSLWEPTDIKDYKIDLPKEIEWTNQLIIRMDQFIDCPFYLTKKAIYVFGEKMAVQLVLFSGNIQKYGLSKAMSVARKQQESS